MALSKLWVEKYRPSTLGDVIFASESERAEFDSIVSSKSVPNLLLVGVQGTGKTTISQALLKDLGVNKADILKINCSDEKIDAIRDKVKTFAYTMPFGDFKVVRLEEIDHLSLDGQALLRDLIEVTSASCRFIATANYLNRIMPAIQSRFQMHRFAAPDFDTVLLRMADILVKEGVEFEVDDLEKIVSAAYPDIRKIIGMLEKGSRSGKLTIVGKGEDAINDWKLQLLPLLEANDLKGARALVCTSASREELQDVYSFLYNNIHRAGKLSKKWDEAVVKIAEYQRWHAHVADPELHIAALFIELGAL